MNIAIIHYHLKPGGVTRVIENAVAGLEAHAVNTVVLSGEAYQGTALGQAEEVPELAYTQPNEKPDPQALVNALKQQASLALGSLPDVWHIHNHSLGKNNAMVDGVNLLAEEGAAILLQIHDFAEDGRPHNYESLMKSIGASSSLYPYSTKIQYAVLNRRDYGFFNSLGMDEAHLHCLPNPIAVPDHLGDDCKIPGIDAEKLILYPTRAIRRKNMGEFVLAAAVAEKGEAYASTLAPANPTALPIYEQWVAFASALELPLHFAVGEQSNLSFGQIMAAANAVMTTSVAEGFGLAFLEPALFAKPLCGRDLPDITADFKAQGVDLSNLYRAVKVPLDWINESELKRKITYGLERFYESYQKRLPGNGVEQCLGAILQNDCIDFARLDEALQEKVILHLRHSFDSQKQIRQQLFPPMIKPEKQIHNKKRIVENYSIEHYGEHLYNIYQNLVIAPNEQKVGLDTDKLLGHFLEPSRFFLLRS